MANLRHFVVRHQPSYSRRFRDVEFFHTAAEAIDEYEKLRKVYLRERVWVVDLMNDRIIADSRAR